jgi:CHAD domain-containing protein
MMQARLVLESEKAGQSLLEDLGRRFSLRRDRPHQAPRLYFDTFDWEIFGSGGVLYATVRNGRSLLHWVREGEIRELLLPTEQPPVFAADLPEGEFRDALRTVTGIRRLLPMVCVNVTSTEARILDKRQKTVSRVILETRSARGPEVGSQVQVLTPVLRIVPIKGYEAESERLVATLDQTDVPFRATGDDELREALAAIGRQPGDYSSKPSLRLTPGEPSREGVARILLFLLDTAVANEEGIRRDLDTEFLHDFRVAVRRTRTALSQIRGVLPQAAVDRFKKEFSWLGTVTGRTRDLDVYLLKMDDYRSSLPSSARGDLEPLETFLARHRNDALLQLVEAFDSDRYLSLLREWREFLEASSGPDPSAPSGGLPMAVVSAREIRRVYQRVLRKGGAIDDASPASTLHRLRIECKKLRYLLEFFRGLYDPEEIDRLIESLKRLQDNLGDFNDYGVQQHMLGEFAHQMAGEGVASVEALMAMGRLVERLEKGEERERRRFSKRFRAFASGKTRDRFDLLFEPPTQEAESQ